jgi:hypothetical protein
VARSIEGGASEASGAGGAVLVGRERAGAGKMLRTPSGRARMPLHPTRRRGETVRGLVYGAIAGTLIWALVLLAFALLG